MNDLSSYRGDTNVLNLIFKTGGVAVDITGWTIFFEVKKKITDTDADAVISKTVTDHTNAAAGLSAITLAAADTVDLAGDYFYDIQVKKGDGTIFTVTSGKYTFKADVTIRTT